jgi:hypothetical protein
MSKSKKSKPVEEPLTREIRQSIADDGRSLYAIAGAAGIDEAALRRFVSRERSLSLASTDGLATALGLKLVRKSKPRATTVQRPAEDQSEPEMLDR